jgi:ribokinase
VTVFVVGALHLDVIVRAPHLPTLDETVVGDAVNYVFGGKGGNQAVAAARLGAKVHFGGRAGSDAFGDMLRDAFARHRIDSRQLQRDPGPSGMSTAIVDTAGDYGAVIISAANLNIDAAALHIPAGTRIVLLQNEVPETVNIDVARKAKDAGAQVWLNAAPARPLSPPLTDCLDLLIVNRVEAAFYAQKSPGMRLLETLGRDGVRYNGQHWPALPVKVLSTHGAGDMFVGALATLVSAGASIEEAIARAQAAAAWHISTPAAERDAASPEATRTAIAAQLSP